MRVLSLFDGISCGMLALQTAGIEVSEYYASEIDKYAIGISRQNFPEIVRLGDVFDVDFSQLGEFDLVLAGSPCQNWSICKRDREITEDGEGFRLFMRVVDAIQKTKPKYFLYENNHSIHQNIKDSISAKLGVEPVMINSALVSAQQRKRVYWTNIPNVTQPEDKGLVLSDILEPVVDAKYNVDSKALDRFIKANKTEKDASSIRLGYIDKDSQGQRVYSDCGKSITVSATSGGLGRSAGLYDISSPVRLGDIGTTAQAHRVYSAEGKSVNLTAQGGGQGAKTGLYAIGETPNVRRLTPLECERLQTLPDNFTKLAAYDTINESAKTLVSDTQRYKCIGNGWTVDVIAHLLKGLKHDSI